jgi:hypothetical protein
MAASLPHFESHVPAFDPEIQFSTELSIVVRGSFFIARSTVSDAFLDTLPLATYFDRWAYVDQAL